ATSSPRSTGRVSRAGTRTPIAPGRPRTFRTWIITWPCDASLRSWTARTARAYGSGPRSKDSWWIRFSPLRGYVSPVPARSFEAPVAICVSRPGRLFEDVHFHVGGDWRDGPREVIFENVEVRFPLDLGEAAELVGHHHHAIAPVRDELGPQPDVGLFRP